MKSTTANTNVWEFRGVAFFLTLACLIEFIRCHSPVLSSFLHHCCQVALTDRHYGTSCSLRGGKKSTPVQLCSTLLQKATFKTSPTPLFFVHRNSLENALSAVLYNLSVAADILKAAARCLDQIGTSLPISFCSP